jgi:peptide/nickel transport system substrate-binding protein
MTTLMEKASFVRLFVLTAVIALVVTACGTETASPGETDDDGPDGTPVSTPVGSPTDEPGPGGDLGTYTLGIFQDVTTDNQWNSFDTAGNTVWNSYFLTPMTCSMYTITYPGIELQADLASTDEIPPAEEDGDVWVAEVTLRDDIQWSDGEAITAEDVAFTWQTALDFQLTANWGDFVDADVVDSVEAVDDQTVRVTFNAQPGLAQWGPGTGVPTCRSCRSTSGARSLMRPRVRRIRAPS